VDTWNLHNNTAHLLYKYCTNCTVYNWTVLAVITHNLPLHVQPHNTTKSLQLIPSEVQSSPLFYITPLSVHIHSVMSLDQTVQINTTATKHNDTCSQHHKTHPTVWNCMYEQRSYQQIRSFKHTPLAENMVWQW
jgi:hypothetical protein